MRNIPFYIAKRYFFSKTNTNAVNIITTIAVIAIMVATAALLVILSVFSGLEKMNIRFLSDVNPELKISPASGKRLPNIDQLESKIKKQPSIASYAKVIEEKVYIQYNGLEDIAYLKSVDNQFLTNNKFDTTIIAGRLFDSSQRPYEVIASEGIGTRLKIYIDNELPIRLIMPKAGTQLIKQAEDGFVMQEAFNSGIFFLNDQYDKHLFAPLALGQEMLNLSSKDAYSLELKTNGKKNLNQIKKEIAKQIGPEYTIQTRQDLDAAFLKVMNIENLIIYMIFTLVIIIACFNLAGTIIIIIIDKREEIKTMYSFGMTRKNIRRIFFFTGLIITSTAMILGLIIASILGYIQIHYPLIYAAPYVAFPFTFTLSNFLVVSTTVLAIGSFVSWLMAKQVK
ncbi:ABC transporter permease [Weeksella virosa]|uniref:ABC3 transporter permease protein domain-containing protein n=1 Tax=Weeksella virosa (strain ATCC 43766 / DSM 16922 / JCM 21250 / CCUG 30538 / CDC 9751 / IAM 14551 / NBRC 16016 / NCTC 11634 / CL345/78) TaxID=865938 RepID=F0P134_WEEVC|nr:FtsX-like permease family protein [Weeksella virosa]ADX68618.1 protein of unknown function DUF214 [Weeksella virosa DSM 16922]SUP54959.1 Lipoprotein-releasing system transmembrane protein lolE [Weeksella virosa]VEH63718.1 Lipoprotein-releasing system transmembrane protein lolE [Weeksella virosa]